MLSDPSLLCPYSKKGRIIGDSYKECVTCEYYEPERGCRYFKNNLALSLDEREFQTKISSCMEEETVTFCPQTMTYIYKWKKRKVKCPECGYEFEV